MSKVDRGRLTLGGALDLIDLCGGAQLILTPLVLICVDPKHPRRALWTVSMRHILSAHVPPVGQRAQLIAQLHADQPLMDADRCLDEGLVVLVTCCCQQGACSSDPDSHLRVVHSGSISTFLLICASSRAAQRLQRSLTAASDLF